MGHIRYTRKDGKSSKGLTIGIDADILDWLDEQVAKGIFYRRRHGIEFALTKLKIQWEKQEKEQLKES